MNCTIVKLNNILTDINQIELNDSIKFGLITIEYDLIQEIRTVQTNYNDSNGNGYLLKNGIWIYNGIQFWILPNETLKRKIMKEFHNNSTAGHFDRNRTLF